MRSFEEAWKENRIGFGTTKGLAKAMYVEGRESRQTEVDELQMRVDAALKIIQKAKGSNDQAVSTAKLYEAIKELEQALKGDHA